MPKVVDHDAYRAELVEGCLRLFAERGFASLTMRDIAAALSVSTGTLYHYFPSKELLFESAVRRVTQQDLGAAEALTALPPSPRARLEALFAHVVANEQRFAQELLVTVEYRHLHGAGDAAFESVNEAAEIYIATIDLLLGLDDPALARLIFMLMNGILLKRLFDGGRTTFESQFETLARLLPAAPNTSAEETGAPK